LRTVDEPGHADECSRERGVVCGGLELFNGPSARTLILARPRIGGTGLLVEPQASDVAGPSLRTRRR